MCSKRILILLLFIPVVLNAYNHPEISWKSVTTEHFIINYYDRTEHAVYAAWKISEDAFEVLTELLDYRPRDKIALSLAEYDDMSNGFAEWTSATIMIWLPDSRFELRSNTTWLRNVITHELTHIMSLEQKRRMQLLDISLSLNLTTPDEDYGIIEPFAKISTYPAWLAEGMAQFETECLGNDCYDSRREMILRSAILSSSMLTLDEMGHFNHDARGAEMVYNQGFAFTKYIAGKIGYKQLHAVFKAGASARIDFPIWFYDHTGLSVGNLYTTWIDSLRSTFQYRFPAKDTLHRIVYDKGRYNLRPVVSPDGAYWSWLSSGSDDGDRTDLVVARMGETRPLFRVPYAHTAHCFSSASDKVYFIKSRVPNINGSFFNDIFSRSIANGRQERITTDGRIYDIAALPGGKDLLCISYRNGSFGLFRCSIATGNLTELIPGEPGSPLVNITVNPQDSDAVIVSKIVDGRSRLFRWLKATGQLEPIGPGTAQEESPFWAPDGRIYFSADYDGVFNIYSMLPDGSNLKRHTSTAGGYFSPRFVPDGNLVAAYYNASGFSIVIVPSAGQLYSVPESYRCSFGPLPRPKGIVTIKSNPYEPKLRRGVVELNFSGQIQKNSNLIISQSKQYRPYLDSTSFLISGSFSNYKSDALQKRQRAFNLMVGALVNTGEAPPSYYNIDRTNNLPGIERPLLRRKALDRFKSSMRDGSASGAFYNLPGLLSAPGLRYQQSGDSESDSAAPSPFQVAAIPSLLLENQFAAPTLGIEMSAQLASLILPAYISLTPYFEVQLAREWQCGARFELASMPFSGYPLFATIPFFLSWSHPGYINEDISYNFADYSQMEIMAGPRFVPSGVIGYLGDTTAPVVNGWMAGLSLFHGIPIFKYGSLQLISSTMATYHGKMTLDDMLFSSSQTGEPLLDGTSNGYLFSENRTRFVFPIARTINHGFNYYFDALYGFIGYELFGYANSSFFDHLSEIDRDVLTDTEYRTESIFLEHMLSAGIELGFEKSFLFSKRIRFTVSYQMLRSITYVSLSSGF